MTICYNLSIWDIHEFTYLLSDEVGKSFVSSLAIDRSRSSCSVTVEELSQDLSALLLVSVVSANEEKPICSANETNNNPLPTVQMYVKQKVYGKELERIIGTET